MDAASTRIGELIADCCGKARACLRLFYRIRELRLHNSALARPQSTRYGRKQVTQTGRPNGSPKNLPPEFRSPLMIVLICAWQAIIL